MNPSEISSYLSSNILAIGISSITPMMYLSMDTIKYTSNADYSQNVNNQCSGALVPQISICVFLLIMMAIKVVIAPLSITTLTANDLIKLNLPHRLISQGVLFGLSFLLNLYLFANMDEGRVSYFIWYTTWAAIILVLTPALLDLFHMTLYHAHRTSLALPPQRSLTSPPPEIKFPSPTPTASLATQPTAAQLMPSCSNLKKAAPFYLNAESLPFPLHFNSLQLFLGDELSLIPVCP